MPELNLDGYTDLPAGKIAAVVTYLEMRGKPSASAPGRLSLRRVHRPDLAWYRALYAEIGSPWLWTSRLLMTDAALAAILHDEANELFLADGARPDLGIVELDRRRPDDVEITFFGLRPETVGLGLGREMMALALDRAWQPQTRRVWLHTCTLDHPGALGFYRRSGFVPCRRAIEVIDDPRLDGRIPPDTAPGVPLI